MIRRFTEWLYNITHPEYRAVEEEQPRLALGLGSKRRSTRLTRALGETDDFSGSTLSIYNAMGGRVIEFSYYDKTADDYVRHLHIIPSDVSLSDGLAKIITYEAIIK